MRSSEKRISKYIYMKREAAFNTTFNHWLKAKWKKTGAFELKFAKGNSVPFSAVVPHQVAALSAARNSVLVYKIPDAGYQNPFDAFCLSGTEAYVVIRYPDFFCLIDINDWTNEASKSTRRSLTAERAKEISTVVVDL